MTFPTQQYYYLPKKLLKVAFSLTIVEKRLTYSDNHVEVQPFKAYIKGDFKLSSVLVPYETLGRLEFDPGDSSLSKLGLTMEYDAEGAGLLLSFNSSQTNLIGDVVSATIDLAATVAAFVPFMAAIDLPADQQQLQPQIDYPERDLPITAIIDPKALGKEFPISLPDFKLSAGQTLEMPSVVLLLEKCPESNYDEDPKKPITDNSGLKKGIRYFEAKPVKVKAIIRNNSYLKEFIPVQEIFHFPQFGPLREQPILRQNWWIFGSLSTALTFSASTGSLQKVCIGSASNIKDWLTDAQKAAKDLKKKPAAKTGANKATTVDG